MSASALELGSRHLTSAHTALPLLQEHQVLPLGSRESLLRNLANSTSTLHREADVLLGTAYKCYGVHRDEPHVSLYVARLSSDDIGAPRLRLSDKRAAWQFCEAIKVTTPDATDQIFMRRVGTRLQRPTVIRTDEQGPRKIYDLAELSAAVGHAQELTHEVLLDRIRTETQGAEPRFNPVFIGGMENIISSVSVGSNHKPIHELL